MKKTKKVVGSASMKSVGLGKGVAPNVADIHLDIDNADGYIPGTPKHLNKAPGSGKIAGGIVGNKSVSLAIIRDKASGMCTQELMEKYSVSAESLNDAKLMRFTGIKQGKEQLKGVLLDNAIAAGMRVRETVGELSPMQAVIATGVMTQRFIDIDKHTSGSHMDIDTEQLSQMGDLIKGLKEQAGMIDSEDDLDDEV